MIKDKCPKGIELSGGSLSANVREVARAVNQNLKVVMWLAKVVKELDEELDEVLDEVKKQLADIRKDVTQ